MPTTGGVGPGPHLVQDKLCDQTVNEAGEVTESVSFLRRYLVTRFGEQVGPARDYQLDGRTPYTLAGTVVADCSSTEPAPAPDPCASVPEGALEPEWAPLYDPPGQETGVHRETPLTVTFDQPVSESDTLVSVGGQPASLSRVAGATYRVVAASPLPACETVTAEVWPVTENGCPDPAGSYTSGEYTTRSEVVPAYAWGWGAGGRVGDGSAANRHTPVPQDTEDVQFVAMSDGADALNLAVDADGQVWAWSANAYGGYGNGTTTSSNSPVKSTMPPGVTAVDVAAAQYSGAFISNDGTVYTTGLGSYGLLGTGGTANRSTWAPVELPAAATRITCGLYHMLALTDDGRVWGWGSDAYGQASGTTNTANKLTPTEVPFPEGTTITDAAAGYYHGVAVDDTGQVWTWGIDNWQQLGDCETGAATRQTPTPITMPDGVTAQKVAAGFPTGAFITPGGDLYVWGSNVYGNCGQGAAGGTQPCPEKVPLPGPVVDIAVGYDSLVALLDDGRIYTWGYGGTGQMGNGGATSSNPTPLQVTALPSHTPIGVAMSQYTAFALYGANPC